MKCATWSTACTKVAEYRVELVTKGVVITEVLCAACAQGAEDAERLKRAWRLT